jgi:hypothetical protein
MASKKAAGRPLIKEESPALFLSLGSRETANLIKIQLKRKPFPLPSADAPSSAAPEKRARLEAAQRRAKNRTRQTERGDWRQAAKVRKRTPVSIEVMSRAAMFAHPSGLVFHRAVKTRGISDCTVCKSKFQPAEAGGYGFARRVPIWDDDLWLITICQQCFAQSDLVEKVRAYVCRENERHDPGEYEVVDVRLVGAKS